MSAALAACTVITAGAGGRVDCTDTTSSTYASSINNQTINVLAGATVYSSQGNDLTLTGNNVKFNNNGTVGPTLLSPLNEFTSAVVIGNSNNSNVNITNTGLVRAIGDNQVGNMADLTGMAFDIKNGATGTINFINTGTIDSAPLTSASGIVGADIPAVATYNELDSAAGAGPKVVFTNGVGAVITGRVAFQGSSQGNTFLNAGSLFGSLSMGTGGAVGNTFIAMTGSTVTAGSGSVTSRDVTGKPITFAAVGIVDGGLNGASANNNFLYLQNNPDIVAPGTGSTGTGSISSANFINFPNLRVFSGTWTILGPLLGSLASPTVQLTGGIASVNDSQVFGTATVVSDGGELRSLDPSVNLANAVTVGTNGLTVSGSNQLTLSGKISGSGALRKSGASTLVLSNATNDYSGGTVLSGGTLSLANAGALGSGGLSVTGTSNLLAGSTMTLSNAITLSATLGLTNVSPNTLTLASNITGSGALNKNGSGDVTLSGTNNFTGGVNIGAGKLILGSVGALGSGTLSVSGASALDTTSAQTLNNSVNLSSGALTLTGSNNLTLGGVISGAGSLTKAGSKTLTLTGGNAFAGGVNLQAGTLILGSDNALGSSRLTAAAGASLDTTGSRILSNVMTLNGDVTVAGSQDLTLSGVIDGAGGFTKNGAARLTLNGMNTYTGDTRVNAGTLMLNGSVAGNVAVSADSTLGGSGRIGGNVNVLGTLSPGNSPGTLTINGNLTLGAASTTVFELGQAGMAGGATNDLVTVGGNLMLGGKLQATAAAAGWYRLFNYGGSPTGNFSSVNVNGSNGFTPLLGASTVQLGTPGQVNLAVLGAGQSNQFWNGSNMAATSGVQGGGGSWSGFGTNWMDSNGQSPSGWGGSIGILGGMAGTVTVDGPVRFDTLQFDTDGYSMVARGGGQLELSPSTVAQGGVINTNGANVSTTISAPIVNGTADKLVKVGEGTLTLAGTNTYTGGTTVAGGMLSVASNDNLGASSGALTLNGGTLQITGTGFTSNNGRSWVLGQAGAGIDIAEAAHVFTLDSHLTGSGGLYKTGSGTLKLSGANNYSGGTRIEAGTLALGAGGSLANTGAVALTGNGATFDISGASAAQTIAALQGVAGSSVQLGANSLTFGDATSTSFDGAFSGSGVLSKQGSGTLTLAGDSRAFSGSTTINAGTLAMAASAQLGGALTVASGATLSGTGTVGSTGKLTLLQSGATVTPGDAAKPYGTLQVAGELEFAPGSTYRVQADPLSNSSSRIAVSGQAKLAGGVLQVGNTVNPATDFQLGESYTILTAASLQGKFDTVASNYAYLKPTLSYTTSNVTLKLERKTSSSGNTGSGTIGFAELAETGNQASVADAIDNLPATHALHNYVLHLSNGAPAAFFSQVSGDPHASVEGSLPGLGAYAPSVSQNHMRNNLTAGLNPGAPVAQSDGPLPASAWPSSKALPAWAEVVGHWQTYNGDGNAARLKQTTTGLFVGMDEEVAHSGWRLGGSLGFTHADGRVADRNSTSKVNSYSAAVYGGKSFGTGTGPRTNVLGGLAYTWHDIATTRNITSLGQTLQADYSAHTGQLFAEVGYAIGQYAKFGFEPFVGVSLGQQRSGSFQERGGFAALQGRSSTDDIANTTLGLRLHSDFQIAGKDARLRATVGWRHAFGDVATSKTMAFEGGQNFTVAGAPLARNTALLGLEGEIALGRRAALVLGYRGELASGQRDHAANVKLRWSF